MLGAPRSFIEFQHRFDGDSACAAYLYAVRWPDGYCCPACGHTKAWPNRRKRFIYECAACRRQTSVTSGTVRHSSKLPLTLWLWAAYLAASHSNGLSALQLKSQLGPGSYKTAWLLLGLAEAGHGDTRPLAARRPCRGRRDPNPAAEQG
jgi:transposase-like protein